MTIVEALAEQERTRREKVALVARREGGTVAVTWGELARKAWAVANGLRGVGIKKGERVAILTGNRLEWAFCDLGILAAGAGRCGTGCWPTPAIPMR